MLKLSKV